MLMCVRKCHWGSIDIRVGSKWVEFQFWGNCPFKFLCVGTALCSVLLRPFALERLCDVAGTRCHIRSLPVLKAIRVLSVHVHRWTCYSSLHISSAKLQTVASSHKTGGQYCFVFFSAVYYGSFAICLRQVSCQPVA